MKDKRRYQRHHVVHDGNTTDKFDVIVEGELVHLMNFSAGGLYFLSKVPLSQGRKYISVKLRNRKKIDLSGQVVRMTKEGDMCGIAISYSNHYDLSALVGA